MLRPKWEPPASRQSQLKRKDSTSSFSGMSDMSEGGKSDFSDTDDEQTNRSRINRHGQKLIKDVRSDVKSIKRLPERQQFSDTSDEQTNRSRTNHRGQKLIEDGRPDVKSIKRLPERQQPHNSNWPRPQRSNPHRQTSYGHVNTIEPIFKYPALEQYLFEHGRKKALPNGNDTETIRNDTETVRENREKDKIKKMLHTYHKNCATFWAKDIDENWEEEVDHITKILFPENRKIVMNKARVSCELVAIMFEYLMYGKQTQRVHIFNDIMRSMEDSATMSMKYKSSIDKKHEEATNHMYETCLKLARSNLIIYAPKRFYNKVEDLNLSSLSLSIHRGLMILIDGRHVEVCTKCAKYTIEKF
jgi:hypothetical protein